MNLSATNGLASRACKNILATNGKHDSIMICGASALTQLFAITVNCFIPEPQSIEQRKLRLDLLDISMIGLIGAGISSLLLSGTPKKISFTAALFFSGLNTAVAIYPRKTKALLITAYHLTFLIAAEYCMSRD